MNGYINGILLAFLAGMFGALQGTINAHIGKSSGQYAMIIGVSLIQVLVASIILLRGGWGALASVSSPWMIVAGALGVVMMYCISTSIGSIGTLSVFVLVISGQIISSALINHFGILGIAQPLTLRKIISIGIIMIGVFSLIKS